MLALCGKPCALLPFSASARSTATTGHDLSHQLRVDGPTGSCWGHDRHPWRPLWHPQKLLVCREESAMARGGRRLWGRRWGRMPSRSAHATSTAPTGTWPSPTTTAPACQGVREDDRGPFGGPYKTSGLQGKGLGSIHDALWGPEWTRLPCFMTGASTAATGTWPWHPTDR
jgi:hypothetical protein